MIEYLGCHTAREMLDEFVDGELPMADQVAVEAHLRWCRTCAVRVEDTRLIGASMRLGSSIQGMTTEDVETLATIQSDVLTRIRAEREQSFGVRFMGLFEDMRYLWPALGATAALIICLCSVALVSRITREQRPNSMADVIHLLANPGSDRNPMLLSGRIQAPQRLNEEPPVLASIPGDEVVLALAAVVTREGRVADFRLLRSEQVSMQRFESKPENIDALLDSVKQARFVPAQSADGAVAVNLVWLLARTTVKATVQDYELAPRPLGPAADAPEPITAPKPAVLRPARS